MPQRSLRSRPPRGERRLPHAITDPDLLAARLEDAAHYPGGHATTLFAPATEAEVAQVFGTSASILPIGAQSSLTGGATPIGDVLLSTEHFNRIEQVGHDFVRVQAGVTIAELDAALTRAGRYYAPAPTFSGAFVGGTIATNAAGAATFRHGTTRRWVRAITVVLASGEVLDVVRGDTPAHDDRYFDLELARGSVRVPIPRYQMPNVPKLSAGYFAAPGMDLIDLFIGSEGTLGVITEATLRVIPARPAFCLALVTFADMARAISCAALLRADMHVAAIEHMDARSLALLREDGIDRLYGVALPVEARAALLVTIELPSGYSGAQAYDDLGRFGEANVPATPLTGFCEALASHHALDRAQIAVPGDTARAERLLNVREAVPAAVNQRVGQAKRDVHPEIQKVAADVVVPFDRVADLMAFCDSAFERRGLQSAVWGHLSDGNFHPNAIPRSIEDVAAGKQAMLAIGREAIRLNGAPLAEHGVGRNPIKQRLLRDLYGDAGIRDMRRVKAALDPEWKLAPGVLFPK